MKPSYIGPVARASHPHKGGLSPNLIASDGPVKPCPTSRIREAALHRELLALHRQASEGNWQPEHYAAVGAVLRQHRPQAAPLWHRMAWIRSLGEVSQ